VSSSIFFGLFWLILIHSDFFWNLPASKIFCLLLLRSFGFRSFFWNLVDLNYSVLILNNLNRPEMIWVISGWFRSLQLKLIWLFQKKPEETRRRSQKKSDKYRWRQMKTDKDRWRQMKPNEARWSQMKPDEDRWRQIKTNEDRWRRIKTDEARWSQIKTDKRQMKTDGDK
jgi:hypothetical protein